MPLGVVSNHQFVYLYVDRRETEEEEEKKDVSTEANERKEKNERAKLGHYSVSFKQAH